METLPRGESCRDKKQTRINIPIVLAYRPNALPLRDYPALLQRPMRDSR